MRYYITTETLQRLPSGAKTVELPFDEHLAEADPDANVYSVHTDGSLYFIHKVRDLLNPTSTESDKIFEDEAFHLIPRDEVGCEEVRDIFTDILQALLSGAEECSRQVTHAYQVRGYVENQDVYFEVVSTYFKPSTYLFCHMTELEYLPIENAVYDAMVLLEGQLAQTRTKHPVLSELCTYLVPLTLPEVRELVDALRKVNSSIEPTFARYLKIMEVCSPNGLIHVSEHDFCIAYTHAHHLLTNPTFCDVYVRLYTA